MKQWLRSSEVARMMGVADKTIMRWASEGRLPHIRTLGGHRRFDRSEIERILTEQSKRA